MFLTLQTTLGEGLDLKFVAFLKAGGDSSPSITYFLYVNFKGFSIYLGNFSKVQETPDLAGLAGLNATSCSIGGFISVLAGRAGITTSSPKIALSLAKTWTFLAF
jgi:hypothetical protein